MNEPILLDIEPAAEALSIGRTTLYGLIGEGKIQTITIGRRRLIERSELDRFVAELRERGGIVTALPSDVAPLSWAAEALGISSSTAYRLAPAGGIPGAFKVGAQWRVSKPRFLALVHGTGSSETEAAS